MSYPLKPHVLDPEEDKKLIAKYFNSGVREAKTLPSGR